MNASTLNPTADPAGDAIADQWDALWQKVAVLAPTIKVRKPAEVCDLVQRIVAMMGELESVSMIQLSIVSATLDLIVKCVGKYTYACERPMVLELARAVERQIQILEEGL